VSSVSQNAMVPVNGLQFCFRGSGSVERWNVVGIDADEGAMLINPDGLQISSVRACVQNGDVNQGVIMPSGASSSVIESALRRRGL